MFISDKLVKRVFFGTIFFHCLLLGPLSAMDRQNSLGSEPQEDVVHGSNGDSRKRKAAYLEEQDQEKDSHGLLPHFVDEIRRGIASEKLFIFLENTFGMIQDPEQRCILVDELVAKSPRASFIHHFNFCLQLAAYCAIISYYTHENDKELNDGQTDYLSRAESKCLLARKALEILKVICSDQCFNDKAVIQPLTLLCIAEEKEILLQGGYELLKNALLRLMHPHEILHTFRQFIILDRQALFIKHCHEKYLDLHDQGFLLNLWKWAELFGRQGINDYLLHYHRVSLPWVGNDGYLWKPACNVNYDDPDQQCKHVSAFIESKLFAGKVAPFEEITNRNKIVTSGAYYSCEDCCSVDLLRFAAELGYLECAQALIANGFPVEEYHVTAAADFGKTEMVKLLLSRLNGEINASKHDNELYRAISYRHFGALQLLLNSNRCNAFTFHSMLSTAVSCQDGDMICFLIKNKDKIRCDEQTRAAIIRYALCRSLKLTIERNNKNLLDRFKEAGAPFNGFAHFEQIEGCSSPRRISNPLRFAIELGASIELIENLLRNGARDEVDVNGMTALKMVQEKVKHAQQAIASYNVSTDDFKKTWHRYLLEQNQIVTKCENIIKILMSSSPATQIETNEPGKN